MLSSYVENSVDALARKTATFFGQVARKIGIIADRMFLGQILVVCLHANSKEQR